MSRWLARGTDRLARRHLRLRQPAWSARRLLTDPLTPFLLLAVGALPAAGANYLLTWAVLGGLAGYTLSGSV